MYTFPIKSPRWIWIALLICLFVVRQYAFPLTDIKCAAGQWKIFNTIHKNYTCRSCPTCPSEHGLSVKCDTVVTQQANLECEKCVSGVNHSSDTNKEQCQPCKSTTCLENEIVNGSCSPEKDTTSCSGICEKGSMNSDKTRCVHLSIVEAGDNITLNDVQPVHTTPSTKKTRKLSGLAIASIVLGCLFTFRVAICFYRKSHSRNQASENLEMHDTDSSARASSTGNIKQDDQETMALISDENNGQLPPPNFGEALSALSSTPQETASTDSDSGQIATTTVEIENEPVAINTTRETPCLDVETGTTARDENQPVAINTTRETPCMDVEPDTTARDENQPVAINTTRETPCLDVETGTTAEDENLPMASPSLSTPNNTPLFNLSRRPRASPTTPKPVAVQLETTAGDKNHSSVIGDLNEIVYAEVCKRLNPDLPGKDWRHMAGVMDFSNSKVRYIAEFTKNNPTDAVLRHWGTKGGNDVPKLITILKGMGRDDVVNILEVALGIRPSSGVEEESY